MTATLSAPRPRLLQRLALAGVAAAWLACAATGPAQAREAPRAVAGLTLDQAVSMAERRYRARVVRTEVTEQRGARTYVLRLLSEEGRVWTVRVDAATGNMR